jgi:hypothetical protein
VERTAEPTPNQDTPVAGDARPSTPLQALDGLDLAFRLPHDASSATALRHSVGGLAFALGLARVIVADVRQALTEISGALLQSVPDGAPGDLEVDVSVRDSRLMVRLWDRNAVMPAMPEHPLSLALVAALSDAVKVRRPPGGGVEVLVTFELRPPRAPASGGPPA